jgi:hypothetical protein
MVATETAPRVGACGHTLPELKPRHTGATGYARLATGEVVCYPCSDVLARVEMARTGEVCAYVNETDRTLTSWPGGFLARITAISTHSIGFGRSKIRHVWATTPDGCRWFGKGSDEWDAVVVRRLKPR